uniref:tRNA pseudouridine synthase n=2 Tax=Amorphochlora amoebiformis TaxID=1561963 RepID=A0A7S0DBR4_9EUKA
MNHKHLQKIQWSRAARTDKGVSALCQICAMRLVLGDESTLVDRINQNLPGDIRIYKYFRVTKSFNAKLQCSSRTYEYIVPAYGLQPIEDYKNSDLARMAEPYFEARRHVAIFQDVWEAIQAFLIGATKKDEDEEKNAEEKAHSQSLPLKEVLARVRGIIEKELVSGYKQVSEEREDRFSNNFSLSEGQKDKLKVLLSNYIGSKKHHNFTIRRKFDETASQRVIYQFEPAEYFEDCGMHFIRLRVHGQSFMLHQIRKMVGMIVVIMRGHVKDDVFKVAFDKTPIHVPKAPALGLYLNRCHYKGYDKKVGNLKEERVSFELAYESIANETKEFRENTIVRKICEQEAREGSFAHWLRSLHLYPWGKPRSGGYTPPASSRVVVNKLMASMEVRPLLENFKSKFNHTIEEISKGREPREQAVLSLSHPALGGTVSALETSARSLGLRVAKSIKACHSELATL